MNPGIQQKDDDVTHSLSGGLVPKLSNNPLPPSPGESQVRQTK